MAYSKQLSEDILKFITLILSKKTKEELQLEVMRYLNHNHDILLQFLRSMSDGFNNSSNEVGNTATSTLTSICRSDDNHRKRDDIAKADIALKCTSDVKAKSNQNTQTMSPTENNADSSTSTSGNQHLKKRRKSKYSYIQGDLSHLCREPKQRKYRDDSTKDQISKDTDGQGQSTDESKDTTKIRQLSTVQTMIDTLLYSKSNTKRKEVLNSLRADPVLRDLFMNEKARLGKMKIPVFKDSDLQIQSNHKAVDFQMPNSSRKHLKENMSSQPNIVSDPESKGTQHLLQLFRSIIRSKSLGLPYSNIDDLQLMASTLALEESNMNEEGAEESITTSENVCFPNTDTLDPLASPIAGNSLPFLQILTTDDAVNDRTTETFYGNNGEVFDNALHEHFQQLAGEQFAENNTFTIEDNQIFLNAGSAPSNVKEDFLK